MFRTCVATTTGMSNYVHLERGPMSDDALHHPSCDWLICLPPPISHAHKFNADRGDKPFCGGIHVPTHLPWRCGRAAAALTPAFLYLPGALRRTSRVRRYHCVWVLDDSATCVLSTRTIPPRVWPFPVRPG